MFDYKLHSHMDIWRIVFHIASTLSSYSLSRTHISFVIKKKIDRLAEDYFEKTNF